MSRRRQNQPSSFWGLLGVVLFVGIVIKFIWWILSAALLILACVVLSDVWDMRVKKARQRAQIAAELAARADQQHRWVLQGDDRGIYGPDGAQFMHAVQSAALPTMGGLADGWVPRIVVNRVV